MIPINKKMVLLLIVILFMACSATLALEDFLYNYPVFFVFQPDRVDDETMVSLEELSFYFDFEIYKMHDQVLCFYGGGYFVFTPGVDEVLVHGVDRMYVYPTPLKVNGHHLMPLTFVKDFVEGQMRPRGARPVDLHLIVDKKSSTLLEIMLILRNNNPQPMNFVFQTGQKYDITVEDHTGRVITTWARDKMFTQAMETMTLEGRSSKVWVTTLELPRIRPGVYTIQGSLTGRTHAFRSITSEPVQVMLQ